MKLITLTNDGYIEYTENLLISLRNVGINDLNIYCVGQKSYNYFKNKGVLVNKINTNIISSANKFQNWRTKNFNKLMFYKLKLIHETLKSNEQTLYIDGDIVFLENTLEEIKNYKNYDLVGQFDFNPTSDVKTLCAGFMMINSNEKTLNLFDPEKVPKKLLNRKFHFDDQKYINRNINNVKYNFFDLESYPNGAYFYKNYKNLNPSIIHFNYIVGEKKKQKMKEMGYWYL